MASARQRGEELVVSTDPLLIPQSIARTSAFFGPWGQHNFVYHTVTILTEKRCTRWVANDVMIYRPTYVAGSCRCCTWPVYRWRKGIWHLSNQTCSRGMNLHVIADMAGYRKFKIVARPLQEMGWKAKRPLYSVLQSKKRIKLPLLDNALQRYFEEQHF